MAATSFDLARFSNRLRLQAEDVGYFQTFINDITNSYVGSLAAIGSTPNANGASLTAGVLTLQPASATLGGVLTAGVQTIGGVKTFAANTAYSENISLSSTKYLNLDGTTAGDNGISYNAGTFTFSIRVSGGTPVSINASAGTVGFGNYKHTFTMGDSTAAPGNATLNNPSGKSAIAIGASSVVITNSQVTAASIVEAHVQQAAADATLTQVLRTSSAAGSFTIYGNANATAATVVAWRVIN